MRYSRIRAFAPALVLVLALAAAVRADCMDELRIEGESGSAVLIVTEEQTQDLYIPVLAPPMVHVVVKVTRVTEVGTYLLPDGSRLRVLCSDKLAFA